MRDLAKAPASARPKQYPILFQALLRSLGTPLDAPAKPSVLLGVLQNEWSVPMKVIDYNECEWSASWCNFATTKLPAIKPFSFSRPFCWEVPRPTTVITEFDHLPSSQTSYCYTETRTLNKTLADGRRLWRLLLSLLTGNTLIDRSLLNTAVHTFIQELYADTRGQYTHLNSSRMYFNWCSATREVQPLLENEPTMGIPAALASVWPGIGISKMAQPAFMGWQQAMQTSFNPFYAQRKVMDVARSMYGTSTLSKQISNAELVLVSNFLLLTALHEEVHLAHCTGLPASTGRVVQGTINQMQAFTRTVVNDYAAQAGKLVAYAPKTFKLE